MENIKVDSVNDEIQAMSKVADAITPLSEDAKKRVLVWASEYFGVSIVNSRKAASVESEINDNNPENIQPSSFSSVAELFDLVDPHTASEKALAVAYWFQVHEGQDGFSSQSVNNELKHLGHGVANITSAFTDLLESKLALQIQKSGKSQQARKIYKLTRKGTLQIESMMKTNNQ